MSNAWTTGMARNFLGKICFKILGRTPCLILTEEGKNPQWSLPMWLREKFLPDPKPDDQFDPECMSKTASQASEWFVSPVHSKETLASLPALTMAIIKNLEGKEKKKRKNKD